jgi:putative transposase
VRKVKKSLNEEFNKANLKVSKNTLFNVLKKHSMLTLRKKHRMRTTNSYHRFYKYGNIIKDIEINRPNQVWASDITYIRTVKGFCYLSLITDMYSRKIVGYDLSDSLEQDGCARALNKLKTLTTLFIILIEEYKIAVTYTHKYLKERKWILVYQKKIIVMKTQWQNV